jgi:hypothetical protein
MISLSFLKRYNLLSRRWKISIILSVILLVALWLTAITPKGILWAVYWPGIFLLQLIIVTTLWRSVPLRSVGFMFLLGMGIVPIFTFAIQAVMYYLVNLAPVHGVLTSDNVLGYYDLMAPVVAPFTEEILKVTPLVLFLYWGRHAAWRRIMGPLDAAVLGGASGAGFEFIENLFRVAAGNWSLLGPDRVAPVASPHIGPFYLFPDMVGSNYYGVHTVWFGHGEMAAAVGLALGLGLFLRKKCRYWWTIPGITLAWAIWDHFLVNYLGPHPYQTWARILPPLDLYGRLLPFCFLAAFLYSIYLSSRTFKWYLSIDPAAVLDKTFYHSLRSNPRLLVKKIPVFWSFWHQRWGVAYGLRDFSQYPLEKAENWATWLLVLREQMLETKEKLME